MGLYEQLEHIQRMQNAQTDTLRRVEGMLHTICRKMEEQEQEPEADPLANVKGLTPEQRAMMGTMNRARGQPP